MHDAIDHCQDSEQPEVGIFAINTFRPGRPIQRIELSPVTSQRLISLFQGAFFHGWEGFEERLII
jgi:hypothetical protein